MHLFYAISSLFYALCFIVMVNPSLIQKYNLKFYWQRPLQVILDNDSNNNNDNNDSNNNDNNDNNDNNNNDTFKDSDDELLSDDKLISHETNKPHNFTKDVAALTSNILKALTELSRINKTQYKLVKVNPLSKYTVVENDIEFKNDNLYNDFKIQKEMSFISDLDID